MTKSFKLVAPSRISYRSASLFISLRSSTNASFASKYTAELIDLNHVATNKVTVFIVGARRIKVQKNFRTARLVDTVSNRVYSRKDLKYTTLSTAATT